jgi:hypothetical protein
MATQSPQPIDASDNHYAEVVRACYELYDAYLTTGDSDSLRAWVEVDRERSRILDARQRAKAGTS